jgi:hypothetical protein
MIIQVPVSAAEMTQIRAVFKAADDLSPGINFPTRTQINSMIQNVVGAQRAKRDPGDELWPVVQ